MRACAITLVPAVLTVDNMVVCDSSICSCRLIILFPSLPESGRR